ncbi:MAG TPA: hypothetical protein VEQ60_05205 [Longimicrobium sp.]|nr:hypothetical protein [Longimicrobium sp.]
MTRRTLSEAEIEARLPVWDAIADLFLDTVIDGPMLEGIARELAASPFSVDELRDIYLYEVAPGVHRNLKIVAGEWAGFGRDWLRERIPAYLARSGRLSRWWAGSRAGRWWRTSQTEADWETLIRRVAHLRAD